MSAHRQPSLHDLTVTVQAPVSVLSGHDGQIRARGVQGLFYADCRALSRAVLRVDGAEPQPVTHTLDGPHGAWFVGLAQVSAGETPGVEQVDRDGAEAAVRVDRIRRVTTDGLAEEIRLTATGPAAGPAPAVGGGTAASVAVTIELGCDLAPMRALRRGGAGPTAPPPRLAGEDLVWSTASTSVRVSGHGAEAGAAPARLSWSVPLRPGQTVTLRWRTVVHTTAAAVTAPRGGVEWSVPEVSADDRRLVRLLRRSLDDLAALRLAEPARPHATTPGDTFLGAGVPWYLTLFGRDSLWAARMLLPLGTALAAGTLRALARRQGVRIDAASGEEPGKIMHELRYGGLFAVRATGPAAYYGTVDATPLWISLLHDAWRWGMPEEQVAALLPHLRAALGWLAASCDPTAPAGAPTAGDGFLRYLDRSGRGLANQGWKDSRDAVRFRDGRVAAGPIALCEVQGYAYQAAVHAAALLDAFGLPDGGRWRGYAADLADRFRARYWVDGPHGPYPALALDRDGRPVDALTSNIGHLLGTGLLNDAESAHVARALTGSGLAGGYGLRTMSTGDGGFDALSYHCGSIWPHDTAIAVTGLARAGFGAEAAALVDGVLAAAESFGYRLPELYGGDARSAPLRPVPYPAACHPQAWSAAAGVAILAAALGVEPDVPGGWLRLRPMAGAPLGAITARGLRVAGHPVDAVLTGTGRVSVEGVPDGLRVVAPAVPAIPAQAQDGQHDAAPETIGHGD